MGFEPAIECEWLNEWIVFEVYKAKEVGVWPGVVKAFLYYASILFAVGQGTL